MKLRSFAILAALAFVAGQTAAVSAAFIDITRPGDPVQVVSGFNQGDGDAGPPPGAEGVENAINDIGQKYLNFVDLSSGLTVTPSANPSNLPVTGVRFYTANDAVDRDPASFQLFGSNDSIDGPWTAIASGNLALPEGRNAGGAAVAIPPTGNAGAFHQEVLFDNADPFTHYQLVFPTLKNAATANSMQIAEVELLVVPEPASLALVIFGALGVLGIVRRR
jgi:hypothetical protein